MANSCKFHFVVLGYSPEKMRLDLIDLADKSDTARQPARQALRGRLRWNIPGLVNVYSLLLNMAI